MKQLNIHNMKDKKSIIRFLFTFVILMVMAGQTVWAWDGAGTSASPWLIKTTNDLVTLVTNSKSNTYYQKFFRLENDLDMNGVTIETIDNFGATFDGNGHAIRNFTISKPSDSRVGLFSTLQSVCTIRNLIIDQASITGWMFVGVLVGAPDNTGVNIENCLVINSSVTSNYTSDTYAGIISGNFWDTFNYSGNYYYNCSRTIGSNEPVTTNIATNYGDKAGAALALATTAPDGWGPISGDGITYNGILYCADAELGPVTWAALQTAFSNASTDADNPTVITLAADITAEASDTYLNLEGGRKVILDLNGHTLDRHLTEAKTNNLNYGSIGCVIRVSGSNTSLTIRDSGTNGTITGGWSTTGAGCINATNGATLRLEGGTITGNRVQYQGGAIYLYGNFYMSGGTITDNAANLVNDNNMRTGSAIFFGSSGDFYMTGGSITGNYCGTTGYGAAGIGCYNGSYTFNVHLSGTYDIGGNQQGTYDSSNGTWSNLSPSDILNHDHMTYVIDGAISPSQTARMIIDAHDSKATITSGWSSYMSGEDPEDYFTLANPNGKGIGLNASGEATIGTLHTITLADGLTASTTQAAAGKPITLSGGAPSVSRYVVTYSDSEAHTDRYMADANGEATFQMPNADASISSEVTYIDADGIEQTCTNFTVIESHEGDVTLGDENINEKWYAVCGSVTINGVLTIKDKNIHLILCDGASFTVNGSGSYGIYATGNLSIYGQSQDTGTLTVNVANASGKALYVNYGNLVVNGGVVSAHGGEYGIYIKDGNLTVNGGSINCSDNKGLYVNGDALMGSPLLAHHMPQYDIKGLLSVKLTMNSIGIMTYSGVNSLDFTNVSGLSAYVALSDADGNGNITLTRTYKPAGLTGMVLCGEPSTSYIVPTVKDEAPEDYQNNNLLRHVIEATEIDKTDGIFTNYILAKKNGNVGFYPLSGKGTLKPYSAYLQLKKAPSSRGLVLNFEEEGTPTGVGHTEITESTEMADAIYDLQGRRIEKPKKGLYIVNGKKVLVH